MFRLLDRYVLRECLGPFFLGLLVFSFMLLINLLFQLAEMIIQRDVPVALVGELLLNSLPNILVITVPMAVLFGVLIAIGRLSSDSELIAMRASGISLFALYKPVMLFSFLTFAATAWMMLDTMPRGNTRVDGIYAEIFTRSVNKQVQPGLFYDGLADKMLFVFDVVDDTWLGVFLTDSLPGREHDVVVAEQGRVRVDNDSSMRLQLVGSTTHRMDLNDPTEYLTDSSATRTIILEDEILRGENARLERRSYKSMTIPELRVWMAEEERTERERRQAGIEIHQKFAIPAACLVFGLFAVPLGYNNRRGGRSSGFALSIPIILLYRILQSNGEGAAVDGKIEPWLAMWLPNFAFVIAGLFLLARRNRDKSLVFSRLDRWIRRDLWSVLRKRTRLRRRRRYLRREMKADRRRGHTEAADPDAPVSDTRSDAASDTASKTTDSFSTGNRRIGRAPEEADVVLRLPRLRVAFPALIDRYLLVTFLRVFVIVVAAGISVYIMADLAELFGHILRNDISTSTVVDHYKFLSFQIFKDLSPLVVLLTVLISFGLLSRTSEIIAAKAAGLSLYRLAAPALMAAALVAVINVYLETSVLPYSNARAETIRAEIKGRPEAVRSYRRADRQWFFGRGGYIYHFQNYDARAKRLQRLHVFRFDPNTYEMTGRLYAQEARYVEDDRWVVSGAWNRFFDQGAEAQASIADDGSVLRIPEPPEFFDTEIKSPQHMSWRELSEFVRNMRSSGQEVRPLEVQRLNKIALPAICLVMALVALPFAFRLGRKGALYGIGLGIGLAIIFYAVIAIFTTLGQAGSLPPLVAVWSPHVLFTSLSLYLFLGVET